MQTDAIAGSVIGGTLGGIFLVALLYYCINTRCRRNNGHKSENHKKTALLQTNKCGG